MAKRNWFDREKEGSEQGEREYTLLGSVLWKLALAVVLGACILAVLILGAGMRLQDIQNALW